MYTPGLVMSLDSRYGLAQRSQKYQKSAHRIALTIGPHTVVINHADGLGGGFTNAIPPSGHKTMCSAVPPTALQDNAWPNSCISTVAKSSPIQIAAVRACAEFMS